MNQKEEHAIVLDYLPHGYPLEKKMMPIIQAIGETNLTLLELVPRKDVQIAVGEKLYIGEGKRDKVYYILGRLHREKLTENAKRNIEDFVHQIVKEQEKRFVEFFNNAGAVNTRLHQLELLPGFGKKHAKEILEKREEKPFESFEDMKKRISSLPSPEKAIEKRILQELTQIERHNLFT